MLAIREWLPPVVVPDAPLAVLVHGVTGCGHTWWRVGPALADAGWRAVAPDQRGHGHSPRIAGPVTVRDLATDLAGVIESLGGRADLLIGHSLGGAVAMELAISRPELVSRVVLEDPPALSRSGDDEWLANLERECVSAVDDPEGVIARTLEQNPVWLEEDARQDVEGKQLADASGIVASFRADIGTRVLDLLPQVAIPTLLLLAEEGRTVFPTASREQLAGRLPAHVRQHVVEAGHTIHRDRFDEYLSTILEWAGEPAG
jgi:pimeloyl-ACP methyl ester carboxylesterase